MQAQTQNNFACEAMANTRMLESDQHIQARDGWLKAHSETVVGSVSFVLVVLLAVIDFRTPPEIKLTLFYLFIIAFAAWSGGKQAGLAVVVFSSLVLLVRELRFESSPGWAGVWNMAMQMGIYFFTSRVISALRL